MSNFPAADFSPSPPSPPKNNSSRLIIIIVGISVIGMALCCGGPLLFYYFGVNFVGKMAASQVRAMIESNPDFVSEIGQIESMELNMVESANFGRDVGEGGLVFDVKGTQGIGQLFVVPERGGKEFSSIFLRLPNGVEIQLLSAELEVSMPEVK